MCQYHIRNKLIQPMRAGWTVIELIFIIVIIGFLASIAIGKLSTTRDDAKLSSDVSNMSICISDLSAIYTATHTNLTDINSTACERVVCYTIHRDSSVLQVDLNATAANYCADIENVGGHLAKTYQFAGSKIKRR